MFFEGPSETEKRSDAQSVVPAGNVKKQLHRTPTALDRVIMDRLEEAERPLTAYDLCERSRRNGSIIAPTQIYRVLNRLMERARVWRIETLGAYLPARGAGAGFLVCTECRSVKLLRCADVSDALDRAIAQTDFRVTRRIVEVIGRCDHCSPARELR